MNEQYYTIDFDRNGINTRVISDKKANDLIRLGFPVIRNQEELDQLQMSYDDPVVDRGARYYPEINTLFTGIMVLLNDKKPIVITTLLQKKERI